jgi:hypothetical protein
LIVLRRQVARCRYAPTDRVLLASPPRAVRCDQIYVSEQLAEPQPTTDSSMTSSSYLTIALCSPRSPYALVTASLSLHMPAAIGPHDQRQIRILPDTDKGADGGRAEPTRRHHAAGRRPLTQKDQLLVLFLAGS